MARLLSELMKDAHTPAHQRLGPHQTVRGLEQRRQVNELSGCIGVLASTTHDSSSLDNHDINSPLKMAVETIFQPGATAGQLAGKSRFRLVD